MKKGEKANIFVPTRLAFGSRGRGDVIPPNANLIFETEVMECTISLFGFDADEYEDL